MNNLMNMFSSNAVTEGDVRLSAQKEVIRIICELEAKYNTEFADLYTAYHNELDAIKKFIMDRIRVDEE